MITNKILSSLAIGLIATSTFGITWKGKFAEQSTSYTVYLAQQGAMKRGASKAKALTRLCDFYKGRSSYSHQYSNDLCWLSGSEDFTCMAYTIVSCEMGKAEYVIEEELDGFYFDEKTGVFVHFLKGEVTQSILSPYLGGRLFKTFGPLVRTGENTYETEGTFLSGDEECSAKAKTQFTKLKDGSLLVHSSSPEKVSAVIFGSCHWSGQANSYYELKKVKFLN